MFLVSVSSAGVHSFPETVALNLLSVEEVERSVVHRLLLILLGLLAVAAWRLVGVLTWLLLVVLARLLLVVLRLLLLIILVLSYVVLVCSQVV